DRRRKMHATVLLRALGYSTQELLDFFYSTETVFFDKGGKFQKSIEYELLQGQRSTADIRVGEEIVVRRNTKFTRSAIKKLQNSKLEKLPIELTEVIGKVSAEDVIDRETGEVLLECNEEVTEVTIERLQEAGVTQLK